MIHIHATVYFKIPMPAATSFAPCLAIRTPAATIAEALWARSSVGRAPPSHGGGHEFESRRVHSIFPWICRLNEKSERRRRHALGLWCSNPAEPPVATASPRPPSRPILNESTPCSPAFVRAKSLCYVRLRASFSCLGADLSVPCAIATILTDED